MSSQIQKQLKQSLIWRGLYFILSFITTVLISRILKVQISGDFSYYLTVLSLIVLIVGFNIDSALTYYSSAKVIHVKKLFIICCSIIIFTAFAISFLFKSHYFYEHLIGINNLEINVYQCSIYYFIGILTLSFSTALLYGLQDFKTSNQVLIFYSLVYFVLIYYRIYFGDNPLQIVQDFCLMTLLAGLSVFLIVAFKIKIHQNIQLPSLRDYKSIYQYSSMIMLGNLVFFFVYKLDYNFVKNWCHGSADLGNYLQSSKFAQILLVVPQIISGTIFPQIANENQRDEVVNSIGRLVRIFTFAFFLILLILVVVGKSFFILLFGDSFADMFLPTIFLIPGIYCLSISSLYSAYFSGTKRTSVNLYAALISILIMIGLSFLSSSFYSIKIAALISTVAYSIECFYVGAKFYKSQSEGFSFRELVCVSKDDFKWLVSTFK